MSIELKNSEVIYTEETSRHILLKCAVINTYDIFNDDGEYSKTSTQFWNTMDFVMTSATCLECLIKANCLIFF